MPSIYHSALECDEKVGNVALLSFRTKFSGPIRNLSEKHLRQEDPSGLDIIDEAIYYFRSNMFFSSYEIKCDADRNIVYLTLYLIECLKVIARAASRTAAAQELTNLSLAKFALPGEPRFPLNNMYQKASNAAEADRLRSYMLQMRQEASQRILEVVWPKAEPKPSKWWLCFAKRKFLNITLAEDINNRF